MTTRQRQSSAASTADEYASEQAREYGKYVARVGIDFHGTRAYNVGDPVPISAVEGDTAWVPADFVDELATAFEGSTTVVSPEPPTIDPTTLAAPAAATPTPITTTEG